MVIPVLLFSLLNGNKKEKKLSSRVNNEIKLDCPKIVDNIKCCEIEDMAQCKDGKLVMCRCWKSKTFPYCDGAHNKHNQETGDNVGPLIIQK
jgi:CDGSH-type Zn-finger protein